jgi:hypothetical protein
MYGKRQNGNITILLPFWHFDMKLKTNGCKEELKERE